MLPLQEPDSPTENQEKASLDRNHMNSNELDVKAIDNGRSSWLKTSSEKVPVNETIPTNSSKLNSYEHRRNTKASKTTADFTSFSLPNAANKETR